MKKITILFISSLLSFILFEIFCRCYVALGFFSGNCETSIWHRELWIQTHRGNKDISYYSIDRYDSLLGWALKENLKGQKLANDDIGNWIVNSNSKACRGKQEYNYAKSARKRILFLGDSYIFGECLNDSETIPYLTGQFLPDDEVINMGNHGYGNDQQLIKFMSEGIKYMPDIVILGFVGMDEVRNHLYFRDYAKPYFEIQRDSLAQRGTPVPPPDYYLHGLNLASLSIIKAYWSKASVRNNFYQTPFNYQCDIISQKIFEKLYESCKKSGAELIILYLPMDYECIKGVNSYAPLKDSICLNHGLQFISPTEDIHKFLQQQPDKQKYFLCHYSPEIARIIAQRISIELMTKMKNGNVIDIK